MYKINKQTISYLKKEKEKRKSCLFIVYLLTVAAVYTNRNNINVQIYVKHNIFSHQIYVFIVHVVVSYDFCLFGAINVID